MAALWRNPRGRQRRPPTRQLRRRWSKVYSSGASSLPWLCSHRSPGPIQYAWVDAI